MTVNAADAAHRTGRSSLLGGQGRSKTEEQLTGPFAQHKVAQAALAGVRRLFPSAYTAFESEIVKTVAGLVDVDMVESLQGCWLRHSAVAGAMERTASGPDRHEIVELGEHRITSEYHPSIDVLLDGDLANTLAFDLTVVYDVTGVSAVVEAGSVTEFRGGSCRAEATLTLHGIDLHTWTLHPNLEHALELPRFGVSPRVQAGIPAQVRAAQAPTRTRRS